MMLKVRFLVVVLAIACMLAAVPAYAQWNMFVSSYTEDVVYKVDAAGNKTAFGTGSTGLALDTSGNLLAASVYSDSVRRYNTATGASMGTFASGLGDPYGITFQNGNFYVCNTAPGGGSVSVHNSTTGAYQSTFITANGAAPAYTQWPSQIVFNGDYAYVSNNTQVTRFDINGNYSWRFGYGATYVGDILYKDGWFWLGNDTGVHRFNLDGQYEDFNIGYVWGLAFRPDGKLSVAKYLDNKVETYDTSNWSLVSSINVAKPTYIAYQAVPEPSSLVVLFSGATGLLGMVIRRRK